MTGGLHTRPRADTRSPRGRRFLGLVVVIAKHADRSRTRAHVPVDAVVESVLVRRGVGARESVFVPVSEQTIVGRKTGGLVAKLSASDVQTITDHVRRGTNDTITAQHTFDAATPFSVSNAGLVANLNADQVDGLHAAAFSLAGHTHEGTEVLSTGEAATSKALCTDGDDSSSWQLVARNPLQQDLNGGGQQITNLEAIWSEDWYSTNATTIWGVASPIAADTVITLRNLNHPTHTTSLDILTGDLDVGGATILAGTLEVGGTSQLDGTVTIGGGTDDPQLVFDGTGDDCTLTYLDTEQRLELDRDLILKETAGVSKRLYLGDTSTYLYKNAAGEMTIEAGTKINLDTLVEISGELTVDSISLNGSTIEPTGTGGLTVRAGTSGVAIFGRAGGDIACGVASETVVRRLYNQTTEMMDIGDATHRVRQIHFVKLKPKGAGGSLYTPSNYSTVRTYDASTDGLEELEDLVCTLISDLGLE